MRCTLVETPDHFPQSGHDLETFVQLFQGGKTLQRTFWTKYYHVWLLSCTYHVYLIISIIFGKSWNPNKNVILQREELRQSYHLPVHGVTHCEIWRFAAAVAVARFKRFCNSPAMWARLLGASFRQILQYPIPAFACNMDRGVAQPCGMDSMLACTGIRLAIRLQAIHFQCSTLAKWLLTRRCPPHNKSQLKKYRRFFLLWDDDSSWPHCLAKRSSLQSACACLLPSSPAKHHVSGMARQTGHMLALPCSLISLLWNQNMDKSPKIPRMTRIPQKINLKI